MPHASVRLTPDEAAGPALRRLLRDVYARMEAHVPGIEADDDPEHLHGFRVALRQTRTLLGQFKAHVSPEDRATFSAAFKWLGQATGTRRDMDVYLERLADYRAWLPGVDAAAWRPLRRIMVRSRRDTHRALLRTLHGTRYTTLVERWRTVLAQPAPTTDAPLRAVVSRRIRKLLRRLRRDGRAAFGAGDDAAERRHTLRITCKKLRYVLELFGSLYDGKAYRRLLGALKALQDALGDDHDYGVERERLVVFARRLMGIAGTPADTLLAMGRLDLHLEAAQERAAADAERCFERFVDVAVRKSTKRLFRAP